MTPVFVGYLRLEAGAIWLPRRIDYGQIADTA